MLILLKLFFQINITNISHKKLNQYIKENHILGVYFILYVWLYKSICGVILPSIGATVNCSISLLNI